MVVRRRCKGRRADGEACQSAPLTGGDYCWMHDPTNAEAATEARRLGGLRRRREGTLAGAYDLEGLTTVAQIRRVIEVAILDTLGLDNSLGRARTLIPGAQAAAKLLETGELEARVALLEAAIHAQRVTDGPSAFDADPFGPPFEMRRTDG